MLLCYMHPAIPHVQSPPPLHPSLVLVVQWHCLSISHPSVPCAKPNLASPLLLLALALFVIPLSAPLYCCSMAHSSSQPLSLSPSTVVARTPLVPVLFVIGDSTADVGTKNYLG
uniref:Uncharacterized protein n=1 Tax=Oryza sativa subsp. japonica TaxID=39947 RepID=Q6K879_ORYSJ|nr:hypothetical protein [Oryza sativa Japonica Group]BAD21750.1 hypothetical protein [Oryza sativa Japonica Group]